MAALGGGGCAEASSTPREVMIRGSATGGAAGAEIEPAGGQTTRLFSSAKAQELFDYPHVPRFELTLPEERWTELLRDAREEEYVEADLSFEGDPVGTVGLRFKGYATLSNCFAGDTLICDKLSMKLRFDLYQESLRFFGMKRLCFNAMHYDQSMLHERLAYDLYRAMGVVAPRAAWATVTVNQKPYGLYSLVESIDGRFTDDRWPEDGDGNLYKEVWPTLGGDGYYTEGLKTNEEQPDHRALLAFHQELATATSPENLRAVLERWLDLDSVYRYLAVDDAINASDGITTFYTSPDRAWTSNHNFYLYQEQQRDRFWLVPWDLDITFWVHEATLVPHWSRIPEDCSYQYRRGDTSGIRIAPGCDPVFQGLGTDLTLYRQAVSELLNGPFDQARLLPRIDQLVSFLQPAAAEDPFLDAHLWADKVAEVKANLPRLRARLEAYRDGVSLRPVELVRDLVNTFDGVQPVDALLGGAVYTNANSTARLGTAAGDTGGNDLGLRLGFEYRDGPEPWNHYATFYLPVSFSSSDVSAYAGVRFRAKSDRTRSLRVELISDAHTPLGNYIYEGWDIPVVAGWQDFELRFDLATLPRWATQQDHDQQPSLADVLKTLLNLRMYAECVGRQGNGFLGDGVVDQGFVDLDDLEFFPGP